ncbi:bifunctional 23S rRNA (guanine(2069)-N(7))-methyltransferase RlmK/23S rRNA (guanine(2445)-N(2))-methyltransferase RlmL [Stieleria sp. JC731]|uniref:bifunctional 23S rRNA (guanine(2069)-N(7))-methyltransferase RlmK/23S rRNA (guanine(2445)-N(2))-methyltransferase RlmL n=1 Tax=Pirellulaceae TaxID=2691357 RepID=UPI001E520D9A|nr:bifunctional 23S rRNA (guanine(2069)-N(7))-methyltransferase RlmK/23S rRNA (guanine(2445)-N(2))-methyltransferase RlmL [Stieleria sp. JC731]MCC9599379.1 bifunctional 23S rRNA (guanine(2069)-N(7))-methyltransferase RlmK/23S rRNA (guanine(2445)-N(2))-methyltransferase RlmL [Stieleria sp. JC731]
MNTELELITTCAFGLEAIVRRELQSLGIESEIVGAGRLKFDGDLKTAALANLHLRCADRVSIKVAEFPAADFDALFETTRAIDWAKWLPHDATFPVTGRSIKSTLTSVPAIQRSVKRAIVDSMMDGHGVTSLAETGPTYRIDAAIFDDQASLTIDTSGSSLHRRGYRSETAKSPLRENLAAAMVMLSFWKPGKPLLDPFCGSGTIPIEAAMIGRNIAPGINRTFAMTDWNDMPADLLNDLRSEAIAAQKPALEERLIGSDIDGRILQVARDNAKRAGVADDIHFERKDVRDVSSKRRFGCLICHAPFERGKPESDQDRPSRHQQRDWELEAVYNTLPNVFRRLPTWSHYVFTSYRGFEHLIGKAADRRRKLYNGKIESTLYQFYGPKPIVEERQSDNEVTVLVHADGPAAFGQLGAKADEQASLFASRLRKRARHLRRWPIRRGITCFRLYERDIPEIPLVVDRYEDHLHITEYERPHERDPAQHANWLDLMSKTAAETLEIPVQQVHFKRRDREKNFTQYEKVDQTGRRIEVNEGGLKFWVNLDDYIDTGLFLDHRQTRSMVRDLAKDKWFLNLFAYTGSFTVYAADGGAKRTTTVDLSGPYTQWTRDNLELNGMIDPTETNKHQLLAMDVGKFLDEHPAGEKYDLVVFDPPTYSRSKKTEKDWNVQQDAIPLLQKLLPLVRRGGVIFFSNNFRRFKFDHSELDVSECHEISSQTVPEDFRNRRIHRCWRIVR